MLKICGSAVVASSCRPGDDAAAIGPGIELSMQARVAETVEEPDHKVEVHAAEQLAAVLGEVGKGAVAQNDLCLRRPGFIALLFEDLPGDGSERVPSRPRAGLPAGFRPDATTRVEGGSVEGPRTGSPRAASPVIRRSKS